MKKINTYRAERRDCAFQSHRRSASYSNKLLIIIVTALLLTACGSASTPTTIPTVSLDNNGSPSNNQSSDADSISAAAVVVPPNEARLSFSTVGRVTTVDVKVGDKVTAGQTLVTLDTTIQEASAEQATLAASAASARADMAHRAHSLLNTALASCGVDRLAELIDALLAQAR